MTRRNQYYRRSERAVRMVAEVTPNYDSQWAAIGRGRPEARCRHRGDGSQVGPPGRGRRRRRHPARSTHES
jgi:hypothetical protein